MKRLFAATTAALAIIAGCSHSNSNTASTTSSTAGSAPSGVTGSLTVFAAASLKSTFTELGAEFQKNNPGTHVAFSFAGSSDLVTQLAGGAPADVLASADTANMTKAVDAGLVAGNPVNFAANTLTIVTAPGNPRNIHSLADLAKPGELVVVCAPQVPCGAATKKVESATGVTLHPVSEESSVTDVLGKVTSRPSRRRPGVCHRRRGRGRQGHHGGISRIQWCGEHLSDRGHQGSKNPGTAQKFVDLVTGPDGRKTLAAAGFAAP